MYIYIIMENRLYVIFRNIPAIIRNSEVYNLNFFREYKQPALGRWRLMHDKCIDYKVDLANEDHCGPCGELKLKARK